MAKKNKKQALGRGLSALLDDPQNEINSINEISADKVTGNIIDLDLKQIEINPFQPRTNFNEESVLELAESIKTLGIIQPITVRKLDNNTNNKYQLVSGERRLRAARSIKLKTIPTYVRIANDQEILEMALVENIQRRDLDPIEIALSYNRLVEEIKLTQNQLSQRVGKKRSTVANYMRLLKLDPIIQSGIRDGFLSMGHGRALINIEQQEEQLKIYEKIISKGLSVRNTEVLVQKLNLGKENKKKYAKISEVHIDAENELKKYLNSSVFVKFNKKGKGSIIIPFDSNKSLNDLIKKIKRED
jgi:ParB family chromosome partitioning protein